MYVQRCSSRAMSDSVEKRYSFNCLENVIIQRRVMKACRSNEKHVAPGTSNLAPRPMQGTATWRI